MPSGIVLGTLILNEIEHLPNLYAQHKNWPELKRWVFVEAADEMYAKANPSLVTERGLSVDGTSEFLTELASLDSRVAYEPFGFSRHGNKAQGKCLARSRYLEVADRDEPEYVFILDSDEFYTIGDQQRVLDYMRAAERAIGREWTGFCFRHRNPWRPPSIMGRPLFQWEVVGGFWSIPLCRGWKWRPGLRYVKDHNTPEDAKGRSLGEKVKFWSDRPGHPECVHMAWSSTLASRRAKNAYYAARGEGKEDRRAWYVQSRAAYETWRPGTRLPHDARVIPYRGPVPECFREGEPSQEGESVEAVEAKRETRDL